VIPAHNEGRDIAAAIRSVSAQTLPAEQLELVVVENGSRDDTAEAARAVIGQAPQLAGRLIRMPDAGISNAKNRGASEAVAPILIFLDADSRASPELAEEVLAWVGRGYPAGSIRIVADSRDWLDRAFFSLIDWGKGLFGIHASMMYCERELLVRCGGFRSQIRLAEDLDLMNRLKRQGVRLAHVSDASIATSARRLHELPLRLGLARMFGRWLLAHLGIGRRWRY
jgi:glycosyltransferase involved in cell wall biosynthesis